MLPFNLDRVGLGRDLKAAREFLGLSLADVAKGAGISASHLWSLEKGERELSLEKFFRVCAALAVPPNLIIGDNFDTDSLFDQLLDRAMADSEKFSGVDAPAKALFSTYTTYCCTVICHCLLVPSPASVDVVFDIPTIGLRHALGTVDVNLIVHLNLKQRAEYVTKILAGPTSFLSQIGLFTQPLLEEYIIWANAQIQANQLDKWRPVARRELPGLLLPERPIPDFDPREFGKFCAEMAEINLEVTSKAALKHLRKKAKQALEGKK